MSLTVGIISPGDMGSAIGQKLAQHGVRVVVALDARSERTKSLAAITRSRGYRSTSGAANGATIAPGAIRRNDASPTRPAPPSS